MNFSIRSLVFLPVIAVLVGGCISTTSRTVETRRTVTYPNGHYELYGAGTAASPYYWAWIPAAPTPAPPPPPLPSQSSLTGER